MPLKALFYSLQVSYSVLPEISVFHKMKFEICVAPVFLMLQKCYYRKPQILSF